MVNYNLFRRADGTFKRELAEFLDRKVSTNLIEGGSLCLRVGFGSC
jgi:hypothetical protein